MSNTYAREISRPTSASGSTVTFFDRRTRSRASSTARLRGLEPMTDPAPRRSSRRRRHRQQGALQERALQELGSEIQPDRPLLVSDRPARHTRKAAICLATALPKILKSDVSVSSRAPATMPRGQAQGGRGQASERAAVLGAVSEPLSHRLFAAADLVRSSRYEPWAWCSSTRSATGAPVASRRAASRTPSWTSTPRSETGSLLFDSPRRPRSRGSQRAIAA